MLCIGLLACCSSESFAQNLSVLYNFLGGNSGAKPVASLIKSGSALYGMTQVAGSGGHGTIFSFDTSTNTQTVLHAFGGVAADGTDPGASLIQVGNTLYGTTLHGGASNVGTIFSVDLTTNIESVRYSFPSHTNDGQFSNSTLIQSGNILYGTTIKGGSSNDFAAGNGTVYAFDTTNNTETVLHAFTGADGAFPFSSLILSNNTLYGLTTAGGSANAGAIFAYGTGTNAETVLHSFAGGANDGSFAPGSLIQSGSNLYGMTENSGASGNGAIFSYNENSNTESLLHSFAGGPNDGSTPYGSLIQSGNMLYGMTEFGGSNNFGTIFEFDTSSNSLVVLYSFDQIHGRHPMGDLLLDGNTLYGMTSIGGTSGAGTIFSLTVPEPGSLALVVISGLLISRRRSRRD
jgi:uncharacterized repeat protein (TIGR03803 family)